MRISLAAWLSLLVAAVGAWMVAAPWVTGYAVAGAWTPAVKSAVAAGGAALLLGLGGFVAYWALQTSEALSAARQAANRPGDNSARHA